jgi:thioredoxin-like negative regulator of GroEL
LSAPSAIDEDLFNAAQNEYLKGNWYEAEVALNRLLDGNILDVEARLMLASLLRRTGRGDEAATQLARLSRTDGAERWRLEIARLKQHIADDGLTPTRSVSEPERPSEPASDSPVAVEESDTTGEAMQQAA